MRKVVEETQLRREQGQQLTVPEKILLLKIGEEIQFTFDDYFTFLRVAKVLGYKLPSWVAKFNHETETVVLFSQTVKSHHKGEFHVWKEK